GDLRAQVAANRRGDLRMQELAKKYGTDALLHIMQGIQDYSERMMRAQLGRLDDGEFFFEDYCDGDGLIGIGQAEDEMIRVQLRVSKRGDQMTIDFTGSDPQVDGPMNAPLAVTASGVYTAVKMIVDPHDLIPPNSGSWRPINVTAPEGSVVNVLPPAPVVFANHEMTHHICDMLFGAVASGYPQNVLACSQGTSAILTVGGVHPKTKKRYVSYETLAGGMGARPNQDGINAIKVGISNTMNTPIEQLEMRFPLMIERYEILPDTGGPGKFRGGCGARRVTRILDHTATTTVCAERTRVPPFGLLGGQNGAPTRISVADPTGKRTPLNSKGPSFLVPADGRIWYEVVGSGGYGDPEGRSREMLRDDVINGYVSEESAARDYGIENPEELHCPHCRKMEEE
ncbi:MAG: hydantoinase B/oxoprolinase family protein, partial [Dehalococcoidia bacterium]